MNIDTLLEYIQQMPEVEECFPFDAQTLVCKTMGKMFLLCGLDKTPLQINLKCQPEIAEMLREQFDDILPGYHMNKKHWNTVILTSGLTQKMIQQMIQHSYDLVRKNKNPTQIQF